MRHAPLIALAVAVLAFAGCEQGGPAVPEFPAQHYADGISALGMSTGSLIGQVLFPSEYAQRSATFNLDGLTFTTHPDGRFYVRRIPSGTHELTIRVKGYEPVVRTVQVQGSQVAEVEPIRLTAARGWVSGRLVQPGGRSAVGVAVELKPSGGITVSDSEGHFEFIGVSPGDYTVTVADPQYQGGAKRIRLDDDERRRLQPMVVQRSAPSGRQTLSGRK